MRAQQQCGRCSFTAVGRSVPWPGFAACGEYTARCCSPVATCVTRATTWRARSARPQSTFRSARVTPNARPSSALPVRAASTRRWSNAKPALIHVRRHGSQRFSHTGGVHPISSAVDRATHPDERAVWEQHARGQQTNRVDRRFCRSLGARVPRRKRYFGPYTDRSAGAAECAHRNFPTRSTRGLQADAQ